MAHAMARRFEARVWLLLAARRADEALELRFG
jgi:hypothetical protein